MKPFLVFPMLETYRLKLRKLNVDDISSLVALANNKAISDHIINIPYPYQEANAVHRLRYIHEGFTKLSRFIFAIEEKSSQSFVGEIGIHLHGQEKMGELGYWIGESYWQMGFAKEAAAAIKVFAFDRLELDSIYATCHEDNTASIAVAKSIGMEAMSKNGNINTMLIKKYVL